VLAPFEWIVQVDRHGILPYQDAGFELRNGTGLHLRPTLSSIYQSYLGQGLTRSLVAMRAQGGSTRTVGHILLQLLYDLICPDPVFDRVRSKYSNVLKPGVMSEAQLRHAIGGCPTLRAFLERHSLRNISLAMAEEPYAGYRLSPMARPFWGSRRIRKAIPWVISRSGTTKVGMKYAAPNCPAKSPE
jgi:hypothetical protein